MCVHARAPSVSIAQPRRFCAGSGVRVSTCASTPRLLAHPVEAHGPASMGTCVCAQKALIAEQPVVYNKESMLNPFFVVFGRRRGLPQPAEDSSAGKR